MGGNFKVISFTGIMGCKRTVCICYMFVVAHEIEVRFLSWIIGDIVTSPGSDLPTTHVEVGIYGGSSKMYLKGHGAMKS